VVAEVEISADPVEIYPLLCASTLSQEIIRNPEIPRVIIFYIMPRRVSLPRVVSIVLISIEAPVLTAFLGDPPRVAGQEGEGGKG